jgi:hypothetical protein
MARKTVLLSPGPGGTPPQICDGVRASRRGAPEDAQLEASLCVPAKQTEFVSCRRRLPAAGAANKIFD